MTAHRKLTEAVNQVHQVQNPLDKFGILMMALFIKYSQLDFILLNILQRYPKFNYFQLSTKTLKFIPPEIVIHAGTSVVQGFEIPFTQCD
ncbi:hypothetical protein CDAR_393451 [Caerostris darwini]|uniref:Cytochrome P450 n=1 Tax=Caerostris darwini TaxID=1538125 RepID=A0AAV4W765_9ARAC|nr:hypothetical protein CDAR_393451 [Caerostris darwini]